MEYNIFRRNGSFEGYRGWQHGEEYCLHSCQQRGGQVRQAVGLLIAVTSWWTVGGRDDKERGNNADAINLRQYRRVLPRLPSRWANEGKERDEDTGEWNEGRSLACTGRLRLWRELVKLEAGWWYGYFAMVDTKGFEHGCGESFRKMSANAWVISWRSGRDSENREIAKNGRNASSNGRVVQVKNELKNGLRVYRNWGR